MNVELFFVESTDTDRIAAIAQARLSASSPGSTSEAPLPSSYTALLQHEPKRKIGVSEPSNGWTAVLESKEVVDFDLARITSQQLNTRVAVVQLADVVGACGTALYDKGEVLLARYSEVDADPGGTIRSFLSQHVIPHRLPMFRELFDSAQKWRIVSR